MWCRHAFRRLGRYCSAEFILASDLSVYLWTQHDKYPNEFNTLELLFDDSNMVYLYAEKALSRRKTPWIRAVFVLSNAVTMLNHAVSKGKIHFRRNTECTRKCPVSNPSS